MTPSLKKDRALKKSLKIKNTATTIKIIIFTISLVPTFFILKTICTSKEIIIPIGALGLFLWAAYQIRRLSENWGDFLKALWVWYVTSFFAFLPAKHEDYYNIHSHIQMRWICFLFIFIIMGIIYKKNKITPHFSEGFTFLLSLWLINKYISEVGYGIKSWYIIFIPFIILSIFHWFSLVQIWRKTRFALSLFAIWTLLFFSYENIYHILQEWYIENSQNIMQWSFLFGEYFLLWISSIYILYNTSLLLEFLPDKHDSISSYVKRLHSLNESFIAYFSYEQESRLYCFFWLIYSLVIYSINYHFQLVHSSFAIWFVLLSFPSLISLYEITKNNLLPPKI